VVRSLNHFVYVPRSEKPGFEDFDVMAASGLTETLPTKVRPETGNGNRLNRKEPKGGY
jgi:hypothetical protein